VSWRVDLLIVGAGIQGATAAYQAASRGLSVLLVDRADIGAGCSMNSMKIAHGGLRYLQSLDLRRCFESIRERRRLLELAPQWVHPLHCRLDVEREAPHYRLAFRSGLLLNELLSCRRNQGMGESQRLPHAAYPGWYDALIEDTERVLLSFIHAAQAANPGGVEILNYANVTDLIRSNGRVQGARIDGVRDVEAGCVLSCTGANRPDAPAVLSMNLVIDQLPMSAEGSAVGFRHPEDGRNLFVVPWRGRSIVGTHNRAYPYPAGDSLRFESNWIDEFIDWISPVHPQFQAIRRENVRFVHAGLLPGDVTGTDRPADQWKVEETADGEIVVRGVKWVTAHTASIEAVSRVEKRLRGRVTGEDTGNGPVRLPDIAVRLEEFMSHSPELNAPVVPGRSAVTRGEVLFAVRHEWARNLEDVLMRRTGAAAAGHPGGKVVEGAAALLQPEFEWSDAERQRQVESFHANFHFAGNIPSD
jgi:glycerol-3-phosphate dehydrogenase